MNRFFLLFVVCLFFVQCSHEKLPVYDLAVSKQKGIIGDTLLFKEISCLTFYRSKLYFSNPVYDHIVSLDKNFNLDTIFGKKGRGPNEFMNVSQFSMDDSLIYVLNRINGRVNIFSTEGKNISEISLSNSILFRYNCRFCFADNHIIGFSSVAETPLTKYNIYTKEQTLFGKMYQFPTPKQTSIRNSRFTAKVDNSYIVVSDNLPRIEIYNQDNLEQIVQYDYSDIPQVKNSIEATEMKFKKADNSYQILCKDIYATSQHLYILFVDNNINQIIKFEIYPVIKPVSVYKLPGKWFTTFCVSEEDNIVYAYEYTENTLGAYLIN